MHVDRLGADESNISGGWNVAMTGAQAEWREGPGSHGGSHPSVVAPRVGRSPQMSLVSSTTLEGVPDTGAPAEAAVGVEPTPEVWTERWIGYGRDRVYVSLPGGVRIGWLNLLTGDRVVVADQFVGLVHDRIDAWLADPENDPVGSTTCRADAETIDLRDGAPIRAFLSRRRRRSAFSI